MTGQYKLVKPEQILNKYAEYTETGQKREWKVLTVSCQSFTDLFDLQEN